MNFKKIIKKIFKWTVVLLLLLCILLLAFYFALQNPKFQTYLAKKITHSISNTIGAEVEIGHVDIAFFNTVNLNDILVRDQNQDTLFYVQSAKASLNYFSGIQQNIKFDEIAIDGLLVNIKRTKESKEFNFSFLVQNKSADTLVQEQLEAKEWSLILDKLQIGNAEVNFQDSLSGSIVQAKFPELLTQFNIFNIDLKEIGIEKLILTSPYVRFTKTQNFNEVKTPFILNSLMHFAVEDIAVNDANFCFQNTLDSNQYSYLSYNNIDVKDINLTATDFYFFEDSLNFNITNLVAQEQKGLRLNAFQSKILLSNKELNLSDLSIQTNHSKLNGKASLKYHSFDSFKDFANEVRINTELKNTMIDPSDIAFFTDVAKFKWNGKAKISGKIKGRLNSIRAKDINLQVGLRTSFNGDFSLNGLPNIKQTFISFKVNELKTDYRDIQYIYSKTPNIKNAEKLGAIVFKGRFDGFYSDFVTYGELDSELGFVNTDINLKIGADGIPSYSGKVNAQNFKLGKWFGIEKDFNKISINASIEGKGINLETIDAELKGDIEKIEIKGYSYSNLVVDGSVKDRFFKGKASINDKNLSVKFDGLVDISKEKPKFEFTADLKKIKLKALNFSKVDYSLSGQLKSNFTASNIDDVLGELRIDEFKILYADKIYKLNQVNLKSYEKGANKYLDLKADNIDLNIWGQFKISLLPQAIRHVFLSQGEDSSYIVPQTIKLNAEITDETELISLFVPKLKIPKKIKISANLNTENESALATINIPKLKFDNLKFNKFVSNIYVKNGKVDMINSLPEMILKDSLFLKNISVIAKGDKDDIDFSVNAVHSSESTAFSMLGNVSYLNDLYQLSFDPNSTLLINNSFWNIAENNSIAFSNKEFIASNFKIYNSKSEANLKVNKENDTNNLIIDLKNIKVQEFSDLLKKKGIDLRGVLNGAIRVNDFDNNPAVNGDLSFLNIYVNDYNVGDFKINTRLDIPEEKVYISGGLFSKENYININGAYSYSKLSTPNDFDIDIYIKQFTVKTLEDFIPDFIGKSSGTVNGNLKLKGSRKTPNLNGFVEVNDVTTTVAFTQVPYTIASTVVQFKDNLLQLEDQVVVQDGEGNVAYGTGKITHQNLKNWGLDLQIYSKNILALKTKIADNDVFYGTAYLNGGASFTGPTDEPLIYIYGQSEGKSFIDVPLTSDVENKQYSFYKFINKKPIDEDEAEEPKDEEVKIMGAKVKLDLDLDEDLELKIILDQDAGDVLKVKGGGNIKIDVGQKAEYVNFFGTYKITEGDYLFTLQNIVNKPFQIEPDSKINFNGDIYEDATVDVSATYNRKVALDQFIAEYISDEDEDIQNLAKNRVPVTLFMDLTEQLSKPNIEFNIGIDRIDPKLRNYVETKLQALKLNEAELNNQIFGVLVLSRFLPSSTVLENSLSSSSSDAVVNTVTELITQQLSRYLTDFASYLVQDLEFYVNFSQYDPSSFSEETLAKRRELQLALSKRFFNDRLTINLGGNFDFGESYEGDNVTNSTFFGANVSFEYAITKNRRWRLKAFTISDYDNFTENNRTTRSGLGLSYKREFDNVYDLFNIKKKIKNAKSDKKNK